MKGMVPVISSIDRQSQTRRVAKGLLPVMDHTKYVPIHEHDRAEANSGGIMS
jgi:hypothetical protein